MNTSTTTLMSHDADLSTFKLLGGVELFLLFAVTQAAGLSEARTVEVLSSSTNYPVEMTLRDGGEAVFCPTLKSSGIPTLLWSYGRTQSNREYLIPRKIQCVDAATRPISLPTTGSTNRFGLRWQGSELTKSGLLKISEARVAESTTKLTGDTSTVSKDRPPQLSTTGIGEAKFGMTVNAVEQALGRKLEFEKGFSDRQMKTGLCVPATIQGLPGLELAFTKGRLDGIRSEKPAVTTKSGFKVGDPEAAVIKRFKGDPTYRRDENRHEGKALMEITLGKSSSPTGTSLMFSSRRGIVTAITAGHDGYVYDSEYCDQ